MEGMTTMTKQEYEERFNAIEKSIKTGGCSPQVGLALAALLGQEYQAAVDAANFEQCMKSRLVIEEGLNLRVAQLREMKSLVLRLWDRIPFGMAKAEMG